MLNLWALLEASALVSVSGRKWGWEWNNPTCFSVSRVFRDKMMDDWCHKGQLFGDDCDHTGFWSRMASGIRYDPTVICMVQTRPLMYIVSSVKKSFTSFSSVILSSTDCTDQGKHPLPGKLITDQKGRLFQHICMWSWTSLESPSFPHMLISGPLGPSGIWFQVLPASSSLHLPPCGGGD